MHEFSVIASIFELVLGEMEKAKAVKVLEVQLEVGELSFLSHDGLKFGFRALAGDKEGIDPDGLRIVPVPALVRCRECGYEGPLKVTDMTEGHLGAPIFQCPKCAGPVEVISGRGCVVRNIRMEVP
jgi:hydrogenase nickel incorporation protein HypA/HybF